MTLRNEEAPTYGLNKREKTAARQDKNLVAQQEDELIGRAMAIIKGRLRKSGEKFEHQGVTRKYLTMKLATLEREEFGCLFLTNQHELIEDEILSTGTIDSASVYPREVIKRVLHHNAAAVLFYHNHPSGLCEPSQADKTITRRLQSALDLIDVRTLDHVIVANMDIYGFAEHGLI